MSKALFSLLVLSVAVVALLVGVALHQQRVLARALPPSQTYATQAEAKLATIAYALRTGGRVSSVLGTGSMSPYIPAAPAGIDPRSVVVAYVVFRRDAEFADIQRGDLVSYHPEPYPLENWLHQAAERDGGGWIMSGYHNARSEPWQRVTASNFNGIVERTFIVRQRL